MIDSVLIVDDEDGVRRTFQEWLVGSGLPLNVLVAADAETALLIANEQPIDLAVLDWNLGSGSDGLKLLEDLIDFQPEIVAILITGFANMATPLDALRMGVRDYIDKNQNLTRETFLAAIRKQLDRLAPAKRQREVNRGLAAFREAVEKILPLVRGAATLNDPVPLPSAIHSLFRFLLKTTGATDGALLVRNTSESTAAYGIDGLRLPTTDVPFHRSMVASIVSLQEPSVMYDVDAATAGTIDLMPFEMGRKSILAVSLPVGAGSHVVLELFDKSTFTVEDRQLVAAASDIATELLRQALAERQTHRLLFDAVEDALRASDGVQQTLGPSVLNSLRVGLAADTNAVTDADTGLRLIEAVRALAVSHGPAAVDHCLTLVESLRRLLDENSI